ncbi:MAG TPA: mannitol dehydrogenase family protein [Alphaproteobacteria bacterium]|nr:mannitol dehydrogenase family protein [Alphaproteobacteria bacterium]
MTAAPQARRASEGRPRLGARSLAAAPLHVARPRYDRAELTAGIVHIGIGAFHRAHQAVYVEDLLERRFGPYGIIGVSLRSPSVRDALAPQDGLYTLIQRDGARTDFRIVGSVKQVLVAPENPAAVLDALTASATRLVTITVTEKGYCLAPDGRLDLAHPEIVHDLAHPATPRSAVGFLVEALHRIRAAGLRPPTILSCDNLPSNGDTLRRALRDFAARRDGELARWIEDAVAVPASMIDRIVPATTAADRAEVAEALGLEDRGAVVAEPFRQWVVESDLAPGMPALDEVGVELVTNIAPYERMKLRLLNGCHSALAYLGQLAGYEYVADAMGDPALRRFLDRMMRMEIAPTLAEFSPGRLADYAAQVLARFGNRAVKHRTWQIAMDGSQKLPQRLLGTIADRLRAGAPLGRLALAVAAWMRFLGARDDRGMPIAISDPRADELMAWAAPGQSDAAIVGNLLDRSRIFPPELAASPVLRQALTGALSSLRERGAKEVLRMPAYGGS